MDRTSDISRRQFLKSTVALAAMGTLGGRALAALQWADPRRGGRVHWGRLKFRVNGARQLWDVYRDADRNLIRRIRRDTNIDLVDRFNGVDVARLDQMVQYPFIFMHDQTAPILSDLHRQNIREYLRRGGFFFIDDCVLSAAQPDVFYLAIRRELKRILPAATYKDFARDKNHEIFRCAYRLPRGLPHPQGRNHGLIGVYDKDRLVALICAGDLHCAWAHQLGPQKEEMALRMGVNIYVYAMTH